MAGRIVAAIIWARRDQYNDCMADAKPFRLTESVKAAG